jgi:hypothetical protein
MPTVSGSKPTGSNADSSALLIKLKMYVYEKYHVSTVISIPH